MRHGLSSRLLAVNDQPVARADAELPGKLGGDQVKVSKDIPVLLADVRMGSDDFARNDQDMNRRLGIDVAKRQTVIIFVDDVGRNFAVNDLLKDVVLHYGITKRRIHNSNGATTR